MLTCPTCTIPLKRQFANPGIFYNCPTCAGRAISLDVVRKAIPGEIANQLWIEARMGNHACTRPCPICRKAMPEVPICVNEATVLLDVCTSCFFIWFDPQEFDGLPKLPVEKDIMDELPAHAREKLARAQLTMQKFAKEKNEQEQQFDSLWQVIPATLGLPVEHNSIALSRIPFVTWGLAAIMIIVFIATFSNLDSIVNGWGLIPDEIGRHGGLAFISSFFLHAGLYHLIGNLYFLIVFGDNTEDVLGPARYLLLIALAACAGDLVHALIDPRGSIPCIGASGGISGVITYYCLRFPKAKIGVRLRLRTVYRYYRVPAGIMLLVWIFLQAFLISHQVAGTGSVSAVAHIAGAAVGVFFWILTRLSFSRSRTTGYDRRPEQTV